MYRPVPTQPLAQPLTQPLTQSLAQPLAQSLTQSLAQSLAPSVKAALFSEKNYNTLQTVLVQDFQQRNQSTLNDQQVARLSKTLEHYLTQVYEKQGDKSLVILNKEVLGACAKDFSQYLQRKEITKQTNSVKTVMDDGLFQETSQRYERLSQERNEVKALPPSIPDFRISLSEDGPPAAEMFERAKKQRELEALRSSQSLDLMKAEAGLQGRITADSSFRSSQDSQNRNTELALVQRSQASQIAQLTSNQDTSLAILPDRRELLMGAVGSFDGLMPRDPASGEAMRVTWPIPSAKDLGQANANPTIVHPMLSMPDKSVLPQTNLIREEPVVSYREVENNLFIYSADRDWLRNNKENRYNFTVNFDPAANGQSFGPTLASQQKFKNIVRIELVKAIMPGESLNVTVSRTRTSQTTDTSYQDNILNLPYVTLRVAELETNNYGTDNFLDRSFGVLQYDNTWVSDKTKQLACSRGFLAMIPKFLKCQKEYYPTPLSTLQKMTIDLRRPNGELLSSSPDTFDIGGIIAPQINSVQGTTFPFTNVINFTNTILTYNVMLPATNGSPANFYINTAKYFSKFDMCAGDRIQISGYTYSEDVLNDATYGQSLRAFCNWINQPEGHIVLDSAYSVSTDITTPQADIADGFNEVGYANFIVIQARYADPTTGTVLLNPFGADFGATLNAFGVNVQSPVRMINMNKQLNLVFRIITREMDALPQLRPNNNY